MSELIDQYDEETVSLQTLQKDTKVEDVVKKFKNQNKVVDTMVVLQKKKVISGVMNDQSYIRRLSNIPKIRSLDDAN